MKKLMKVNVNINKDDATINDYLFCFSEFNEMPNKIAIYHSYDSIKFSAYIDTIDLSDVKTKEIIPSGSRSLTNEKHFVKIDDGLYISYIECDKGSDKQSITDVIIYHKSEKENNASELLSKIEDFKLDYQQNEDHKFNTLVLNSDGLYLEPTDVIYSDYENMNLYYNKSVMKKAERLIKDLKSRKKGISIVYGERGTGKTSLSTYISSATDRLCIFIPSNMIDLTNSNEFKNLIKRNSESILIIDDSEIFFSNAYTKSNIFTNNLIQMVDGFTSDMDNLHIIIILNVEDIGYVDQTLLECNNLIGTLFVDRLKNDSIDSLCSHLKRKNKFKSELKLVDVLYKKNNTKLENKIGF